MQGLEYLSSSCPKMVDGGRRGVEVDNMGERETGITSGHTKRNTLKYRKYCLEKPCETVSLLSALSNP